MWMNSFFGLWKLLQMILELVVLANSSTHLGQTDGRVPIYSSGSWAFHVIIKWFQAFYWSIKISYKKLSSSCSTTTNSIKHLLITTIPTNLSEASWKNKCYVFSVLSASKKHVPISINANRIEMIYIVRKTKSPPMPI